MLNDMTMPVVLSLFVILGAFVSLLLNLNEAIVKKDFSFKVFVKQNWLATITNIIVGVIIVLSTYDDSSIIPMTKLTACLLGVMSQQFFKKLCNLLLLSKPTFIGINDVKKYEGKTSDYKEQNALPPQTPNRYEKQDIVDP